MWRLNLLLFVLIVIIVCLSCTNSSNPVQENILSITNYLDNGINIYKNGVPLLSVPPLSTVNYKYNDSTFIVIDWVAAYDSTIQGTPEGDSMSGSFDTIIKPKGTYFVDIDNIIGSDSNAQWFFEVIISNYSSEDLLMGVNFGLPVQNLCNCLVPANSEYGTIGYYHFYSNSNVVAFKSSSNYTGNNIYWEYGYQFTVDDLEPGSGELFLQTSIGPIIKSGRGNSNSSIIKKINRIDRLNHLQDVKYTRLAPRPMIGR